MAQVHKIEQDWINLSTMGHIGHGKSTLIGFLLTQLGVVRAEELREIELEARKLGKEDKLFAFILDREKKERESGFSIVPYHYSFFHAKCNYMIVDCPGHKNFVRNMILGAVQADVGILVVAADDYETALMATKLKKGGWVIGQAREHSYIAQTLGVKQLIVVVSKMDAVEWNENTFTEVSSKVTGFLKNIGYNRDDIICLPVGGKPPEQYGKNVVSKHAELDWYDGPTFLEALTRLKPPRRHIDLPLRLPIERVYPSVPGTLVVCGKIETGKLSVEDDIVIEPSHEFAHIRSIRMRDERGPAGRAQWSTMNEAKAGNIVGLGISKVGIVDPRHFLEGNVISHITDLPKISSEFEANICIVWHPTEITLGYSPIIHVGTARSVCTFVELLHKKELKSDKILPHPSSLTKGDIARVRLKLRTPIAIECYDKIPSLGRFVLRDHGLTVAGGIVVDKTCDEGNENEK